MIHDDLYAFLSTRTAVIAIAGDRIFPLVVPQDSYDEAVKNPCLVFNCSGVEKYLTTCGMSTTATSRMRIDSYAKTFKLARQLAAAVRDSIADYSGPMGAGEAIMILFQSGSEFDLLDVEPGLYRVTQTYNIWHTE